MMHCHKPPNDQTLDAQNPENKNVAAQCLLFGLNEFCNVSESNIGVPLEGKSSSNLVDINLGLLDSGCIRREEVEHKKTVKYEELSNETFHGTRKLEVCGGNISLYVDLSGSLIGPNSDPLAGLKESEEIGDVAMEELSSRFSVGDIVWIRKMKESWWPGKIYDPLDAERHGVVSDEKKNCLLVGDSGGSYLGWCLPSQLKPFYDNFDHMIAQNRDTSFLEAVDKAANEYSVARFDPFMFVTQIKELALSVSDLGILELTVAKRRLAAFYRFRGHVQLPMGQLSESIHDQNSASDLLELRERKKSKYLMFPYIDVEHKALPNGITDDKPQEAEAEKVAKSRGTRFQKKWVRQFASDSENVSSNLKLANSSVADLLSELCNTSVDCQYPNKCKSFDIIEWFFSKFRISAYHDESTSEPLLQKGLPKPRKKTQRKPKKDKSDIKDVQKKENTPNVQDEQKIPKKDEDGNSAKPESEPVVGVVDVNMNIAKENSSGEIGPPTPNGIPAPKKRKRGPNKPKDLRNNPITAVPDLNGNGIKNSGSVAKRQKKTDTAAVNSSNSRLSTVSVELKLPCPISAEHKKERLSASLPIPNPTEPPKKRKRRMKKEMLEQTNGETQKRTALLLSFTPGVSVPSKEALLSTFRRFGQLSESEVFSAQHVGTAQVVFVKGADVVAAVRSLESGSPFGATLVGHRVKHLPAVAPAREEAEPKLAVPARRVEAPPVDFMRRNLEMMTSMLEKSGDKLSAEMRVKLECEIRSLLKKVNSLPCSSSS